MSGFTFIIGGARSGKSAYALERANAISDKKGVYIATAKSTDLEMDERIRLHREARGARWTTVEEEIDIATSVKTAGADNVVIVDCLTLWLSNLMETGLTDEAIINIASAFASACNNSSAKIFAVSNEVGLSIVPDNPLARRFRDLSGIINQTIAKASTEAFLIVAGQALKLK